VVDSSLVFSLIIVAVALFLLSFRRARKEDGTAKPLFKKEGWTKIRLTAGADNRDSTSKTVVLGWTAIVAWVVIAAILTSKGDKDAFQTLMGGLNTSYFAVLGGPVLAAFLAKAVTDSKTAGTDPSIQKTEAAQPALGDLVTTDNGGLSVADAQYVILNLCAAAYVVYACAKHPELGVPEFPEQLALLSGGSAATYAGTKSWTVNAPKITAMTPTKITAGGDVSISIRGSNLVSPGRVIRATNPDDRTATITTRPENATRVEIGGWPVPADKVNARSDEVVVTGLPAEVVAAADPYDVTVVTAAGLKEKSVDKLTVV
jgi:hypothetical protein